MSIEKEAQMPLGFRVLKEQISDAMSRRYDLHGNPAPFDYSLELFEKAIVLLRKSLINHKAYFADLIHYQASPEEVLHQGNKVSELQSFLAKLERWGEDS